MTKAIRSKLSNIYIISYIIFFSFILFIKSSQFNLLINSSVNKFSFPYLPYILILSFYILLNIIISLFIGIKYDIRVLNYLSILLVSFIISILFHIVIMAPPLFLFCLLILNARIVNPYKFIKCDFIIRLIILILIVSLYIFHLYPKVTNNATRPDIRSSFDTNLRYSFGFASPDLLAIYIFCIFISYIIFKRYKNYILSLLVIISIYFGINITTDCRAFEYVGALAIFLLIISNFKVGKNIIKDCVIPAIFISILISILFVVNNNVTTPFLYWVNKITSNRVILGSELFSYYPIHFTGYLSTSLTKAGIDNMYLYSTIRVGLIGFIIFEFFIIKSGICSIKEKNCFVEIGIICTAFILLTINTYIMCVPFIYAVSLLNYDKMRKKEVNL